MSHPNREGIPNAAGTQGQPFQSPQQATAGAPHPPPNVIVTPPPQNPQQRQQQQHPQPPGQDIQQQPQAQAMQQEYPTTTATTEASVPATSPTLKGTLQNISARFTSPTGENTNKPNMGFTPTPAMVKRHEQHHKAEPPRPLYQFQVTKLRTWRTGYVRLLCLYPTTFCTIDPDYSHQVTNTWSFTNLTDWLAIPNEKDVILLQLGNDKLKLKCHDVDRSVVLTALLECKFRQGQGEYPLFEKCLRQTRHGTKVATSLKVAPHGVIEQHPTTKMTLQTYRYVDILGVSFLSDDTSGIVLHFSTKLRVFFVESSRRGGNGRSDLLTGMREQCEALGIELRIKESCTLQSWMERRRALGRSAGPIVTLWEVTKTTRRHDAALVGHQQGWMRGTVNRRLAITGKGCLLEMDAGGVVSCHRLGDLHALVRHSYDDTLTLEYKNGSSRLYASANRDALLVSLLDAANYLGNNASVHVSNVTSGGYCLSALDASPAEAQSSGSTSGIIFQTISIPVYCLKRLHAVSTAAFAFLSHETESSTRQGESIKVGDECRIVVEACREFNASVPPTGEGLPVALTDKFVLGSVGALWGILSLLLERPSDNANIRDWHEAEMAATPMFQALYRLSQTPAGYRGTAELDTMQDCIGLLWQLDDSFCQFWMLRVLRTLLTAPAKRDKEVEFVNKTVILRTGGTTMIDGLVSTMLEAGSTQPGGGRRVSDLILFVASDILQSVLCTGYDTTSPEHFSAFIKALAHGHRALLTALRSPTPFVIENTALLLHLLSTHDPTTSVAIREAALGSGLLLQHFHAAIFSPLEGQRFLSRYLCSLWLSGPMDCDEKRLLKRMVPSGFIGYLKMPLLSRMEEEQLDELERDAVLQARRSARQSGLEENDAVDASGAAGTNTSRLRSRVALAVESSGSDQKMAPENFRIFFHVLTKDHALADLIWNQQTRQELRMALENEIQSIRRATESRGGIDNIAWNHQQFTVDYPSLDNEVKVGTVYMRLWLQAGDGFIKSWEEPYRLFELLFRRFLCELDRNPTVTIMCIRCLERLYAIHADDIGPFSDIMILVRSMASTKSTETQHRLLGLVATLLGVSADEERHGKISIPENAEQLLNIESIGQLCQFVAWGHTSSGDQIGNLLSKMLGVPESQKKTMITDGTESRPGDASAAETFGFSSTTGKADPASDSGCPPVWFVSRTGRTPPPPETIKGPFRVSELMSMMQSGELSPYDQVTASHVEDYNEDEPESTESDGAHIKDAHIDTGKWRRINQVWQLRWQLCSDGNTSGIYGPSEVALIALKALTRLVDLHKSLDSRGVPYFPVPFAKRLLCGLSREVTSASESDLIMDQSDLFLPILSQSLLCNDHRAVATSAELLHKLMLHNEDAVSKFYLTGAYFFAMNYTGNNFRPLAELLHATHLRQHFRSGFAAAADDSELPLKDRSILGNMLPEGLLFVLVNYGVDKFTEIFVGNYDTPEVIWNLEMRKHLVEMIRQHLGDFPKRLWQNTTSRYEYCPIPGISYQRLEKEIFCHNYYLHNLCDETRFPDWPIAEPVEVFRACLEEWKLQLRRDAVQEEDAQEQARIVLSLNSGDGSKELRKSYRGLARKYHPDKNPAGRDMFEAIQEAYELLLPVVEGGGKIMAKYSSDDGDDNVSTSRDGSTTAFDGIGGGKGQMQTMHLLIKTQLLICKRYSGDLSKYKYPAYRMLLGCLDIPPSCRNLDLNEDTITSACLLMKERSEFVRTASDLIFHTCLVSPLNGEELMSEGGLPVLEALLDFYVNASSLLCDKSFTSNLSEEQTRSIASESILMNIISDLVHTISGVAFFESGRKGILSLDNPSQLCVNMRRCIECRFKGVSPNIEGTSAMKRFGLEGVANMAKDTKLQHLLVGCGIIWPLLRYMLAYDPTLDGEFNHDEEDVNLSQATNNELGRLSARALGMLSGVMTDASLSTPQNKDLQMALNRLLTEPIAQMLRNKRTSEILRTLNTNVETPVRIWNVGMRAELTDFVSRMEKERPEDECRAVSAELGLPVTSFEYSVLKDETVIGGVYIRVFNSLGGGQESLRELADTSLFATNIISFIALCMNQSSDMGVGWSKLPEETMATFRREPDTSNLSISSSQFSMAVKALSLLVRIDGLVDDIIMDSATQPTAVLLSLLELPQTSEAFYIGCDILSILSPKQFFADSVAKQDSLWRLLWVLERPDGSADDALTEASSRLQRGWSLLESLSSSSSIASKMVHSSGWMELLGIIAGYESFTKLFSSRIGSAKTLSRLLWDENTGPLAGPLLQRFLPPSLEIVLKEKGPEAMLKLFDKETETPEVIWNGEMRSELRVALAEQLDSFVKGRSEPSDAEAKPFQLSPSAGAKYRSLQDELYIGGVYVRLFLKEPTFNLRDPTGFLEKLMIRWTHELEVYTPPNAIASKGESEPSSTSVTEARQDVLQLVTSASVYLCKVRDSLCDKLAQWGYMSKGLALLHGVLECDLLGAPLLSIMRIFHVAVNRQINVEALALAGGSDGRNGIVQYTMEAIGKDPLHTDTAFLVEVLLKVYRKALGDVKRGSMKLMPAGSDLTGTFPLDGVPTFPDQNDSFHAGAYAMAPSPAPGLEPVRKNNSKTKIDHPLDHPLAAFAGPPPPTGTAGPGLAASRARTPGSTGQQYGQASLGGTHPLAPPTGASAYSTRTQSQDRTSYVTPLQSAPSGASSRGQSVYASPMMHENGSAPQTAPVPDPAQRSVPNPLTQPTHRSIGLTNALLTTSMNQSQVHGSEVVLDGLSARPVRAQQPNVVAGCVPSFQNQSPVDQVHVPFQPSSFEPSIAAQQGQGPQFGNRMTSPTPQRTGAAPVTNLSVTNQSTYGVQSPLQLGNQGYQASQYSTPMHPSAGPMYQHQDQQGVASVQSNNASAQVPICPSTLPTNGTHQQHQVISQVQEQVPQQQSLVQNGKQIQYPRQQEQIGPAVHPRSMPVQVHQPSPSQGEAQPGAPSAQTGASSAQTPLVETVMPSPAPAPVPQYHPTPVEGTGIDARSEETPKQKAEQQILSSAGAPGSAQGRVALLESALACELAKFLVDDILENESLKNVKDPAAAKVHAVELLKLLTMDPGYGLKFKLILDEIPAWKKYKSQDHSLFITGSEQKADYFLTDGDKEPAKLLTEK